MRRRRSTHAVTTEDAATPAGPVVRALTAIRARLGLAPRVPRPTDREVLDLLLDGQAELHELVGTLMFEVRQLHMQLDAIETQLSEPATD